MAHDRLGAYRGKEVYVIPKREFLFEISEQGRTRTDIMWMIGEDRKLINGGMIIGQVTPNLKSVDDLKPLHYSIVYGTAIRGNKKEEPVVAKQPQTVVTERATVEALFAQGEKKLIALIRESEESLANYESGGAVRLQDLVNEGKEKAKQYGKRKV